MEKTTTYHARYTVSISPEFTIQAPEGLDYDELKKLFTKELLKTVVNESDDLDIRYIQHFDVDGDELL